MLMRHPCFGTLGPRFPLLRLAGGLLIALLLGSRAAHGQWITQTNNLVGGWNAVFLHLDASHATLDDMVGSDGSNPILEIWQWLPSLPTGQFIDSPQRPSATGSQWSSWTRSLGPASALRRLSGNGAYLVRIPNNVATYAWRVKGKPTSPSYRWTLTGLNLVGFPTVPGAAPSFQSFFAATPDLLLSGEVYRYRGGNLDNNNPQRINNFLNTTVVRDQAYWVRAGQSYNEYFGPIQLLGIRPEGIRFDEAGGQSQFRIRNVANVPLTVTLRQLASEAPPAGQPPLQGPPTLLLRGDLNTTNLTFHYTNLASGPQSWNLAPAGQVGSEVEVVIGLNRSAMTGAPGTLYGGILRFTDSQGLSQINVSVSAQRSSAVGLWVGNSIVSYVSHYLKPYARATNEIGFTNLLAAKGLGQGVGGYFYEWDPLTGRVLVFGGPEQKTGSYLLDGPIKIDSGTVAKPFPLRLIVHNDGTSPKLLQKVFFGVGLASNLVVTTHESSLLPAQLGAARRSSAVHLPTSSGNLPWSGAGTMQRGASLTFTVPLRYDDQASNPFLHTYHPDHDNLDAQFTTPLAPGLESYEVTRQVTLNFTAPEDNFNSLTQGSEDFVGNYSEVITFGARAGHTREYNVLGTFTLKRISDIATLTQ